ncbi:sensor histidine kinase [Deinococcus hopiensis]|uniref:histidine kinase n=1 Tax=Deinococcus hopiensis KR-140 TaxID=695939 RepID=A0A1W1UT57_9DEIO|nr:sensor histidine kinase [Deinococcus hopiensis]SMB84287.1 Signal transduction histidine kinase [Deinococcus hopiensis KR-140]
MNQRFTSPLTTALPLALAPGTWTAALFVLAYGLTLSEPLPAAASQALPAVLGAAYVLAATLGFRAAQRRKRPFIHLTYFCFQGALGVSLVALGGIGIGNVLLLLLLINQASQVLPLGWALAACALLPLAHLGMRWNDALREGLGLLIAGVFVVLITRVAVGERRVRAEKEALAEELRRANAGLLAAAAQAEELSTMRERNRLAREIHDGLGHHLTALHMQLQAAQAVFRIHPEQAERALERAQALTGEALADTRRSVAALRTPLGPLPDALHALTQEVEAAGVAITIHILGPPQPIASVVEQGLYRVAQEALTNARKHAQATQVTLTLEHHAGAVSLSVRDNGVGTVDANGGYGLLGVRERVGALGGTVQLDSAPNHGLTLRVTIPM